MIAINTAARPSFGMSDDFGMTALEGVSNQYLSGDTTLACSAETAARIDRDVIAIIRQCHDDALAILRDNVQLLHDLAAHLLERETITGEEFMSIVNASEASK